MDHDHLTHKFRRSYERWRLRHGVSETSWKEGLQITAGIVVVFGAILLFAR